MVRLLLATALLTGLNSLAGAQALTLADVKAKNAVQLSSDELKQLMPGSKVVNQTASGSTRSWQNSADGGLSASSDLRGTPTPRVISGSGTWQIDDKGAYCVHIRWVMQPEDWCRYIFKAADKYYTFSTLEDTARSWAFEISK